MTNTSMIFSSTMVRALIDGRKTQTRRLLTPQPPEGETIVGVGPGHPIAIDSDGMEYPGPESYRAWGDDWSTPLRWRPGDRLWVREATRVGKSDTPQPVVYPADGVGVSSDYRLLAARYMRREHSRLMLTIEAVRAQRLHEISDADAVAEGLTDRAGFAAIWGDLHGYASWETDPWVVALTFSVARKNIDEKDRDDA